MAFLDRQTVADVASLAVGWEGAKEVRGIHMSYVPFFWGSDLQLPGA